jgi:long-subunit acyl-CoA synthetase (AMP-forming)
MPGEVGPLVPNTECRIVDVMTGEDAPAGEPGELLIRGPQVMKGYLNNLQATASAIDADGWVHTGDVARIEENGSLRIVDGIKELIKYKGLPDRARRARGAAPHAPGNRRRGRNSGAR